jgi:hypothetical protein
MRESMGKMTGECIGWGCVVNGQDTERLELERAGWERLVHEGEVVWRNPVSGLVYSQGIAISMVLEGADPDVPLGPEGGS